jgi:hypothetical protein
MKLMAKTWISSGVKGCIAALRAAGFEVAIDEVGGLEIYRDDDLDEDRIAALVESFGGVALFDPNPRD